MGWYDRRTRHVRDLPCGDARIFLEIEVRRVLCKGCGRVKRERLDFLTDNPFYTKRFAYYVGRRCRAATIKDIAEALNLHWETIKTLEMQYMQAQLAKAGAPGPKAIGIDEISIRKGHTYRIAANNRLNRAYLLKESFGQLWDYESEGWARRFFENWRASLKWQRLEPYEKFSEMIERHWDGIATYCKPENKVSPGFVERLNNKIRVIQRRAYGLRDEEYLRLKVLTCMLQKL